MCILTEQSYVTYRHGAEYSSLSALNSCQEWTSSGHRPVIFA